MPNNLTMPRLSDTMEAGTIVKWHVKPGQRLRSGDVVADIETDKATMELQTFDDGVVSGLSVAEGQSVPVGTLILTWEGGSTSQPMPQAAAAAAPEADAHGSNGHPRPAEPQPAAERVVASPLARKVAADAGVDLRAVQGTGPGGRITRQDVESAISSGVPMPAARQAAPAMAAVAPPAPAVHAGAAPAPLPAPAQAQGGLTARVVALSNMRRTIAARLVESKSTIPHYQVTVAVRMDALMSLRAQLNDQLSSQGVKLSVNDFLVRACALAMHQHPYVNSRWEGAKGSESIRVLDQVNIGVAVALPEERGGGLVVATLRRADAKGLRQISAETRALADKARSKGLTVEEMAESTFTISNLGMFGVEHFTAIINPPNAAILAVGAAVKVPLVETTDGRDQVVIGHQMQMTMSSDHRIVDGAMAAQYLGAVKGMLERPATLLV
ncbi:MAG: hypothetical protein C0475_00370 [Planctomyces sp.]|nr:hypothetical protein [Planctomyces sp.]MBA4119182.1 hypothetical protein [Isosphaera sp.]